MGAKPKCCPFSIFKLVGRFQFKLKAAFINLLCSYTLVNKVFGLFFPYLMICPPVTFSNMSHSVRKIPLTPFSWTDESDTGYSYQISSCDQKN